MVNGVESGTRRFWYYLLRNGRDSCYDSACFLHSVDCERSYDHNDSMILRLQRIAVLERVSFYVVLHSLLFENARKNALVLAPRNSSRPGNHLDRSYDL